MDIRIEHMSLVVRMFHFETIVSGLNVLVGDDFVARSIDISFNLGLLKSISASAELKYWRSPNRCTVTSHPVEIVPLQYTIPAFPCVIVFPLLHQPSIEIRGPNLLEDAPTLDETRSTAGRYKNRRLWCFPTRIPLPQENSILFILR